MKKLFSLLLVFALLLSGISVSSASQNISVYLNGQMINLSVPAQMLEGRTMVPLREPFEALGLSVSYESSTKLITGAKSGLEIKMQLNKETAYVNGKAVILDVPPTVVEGRTLVPLRFIGEATGANVEWNASSRSVMITEEGQAKSVSSNVVEGNYAVEYKGKTYMVTSEYWDVGYLHVTDDPSKDTVKQLNDEYTYKFVIHKDIIYYVTDNPEEYGYVIQAMDLKGEKIGNPIHYASDFIRDLMIENNKLYFNEYDGETIYAYDLETGESFEALNYPSLAGFSLANDYFVLSTYSEDRWGAYNLTLVDRKTEDTINLDEGVQTVQVNGKDIYYNRSNENDEFALYKYNTTNKATEKIVNGVGYFEIHNNAVYYSNMEDTVVEGSVMPLEIGKVYSYNLLTKSKRQLTETHGDPFAVAQGYIYLEVYFDTGSYNGSEKRKVDINGGEVMSLPYQE